MNIIKRLLIENANNSATVEAIKGLAQECIEYVTANNDYVEDGELGVNSGLIYWDFTQEGLDVESIGDLGYEADQAFHAEFNSRVKVEYPELF